MIKTAPFICLMLFLTLYFRGNTLAQNSMKDSLRLQIAKETNDTSRIKLLIRLWSEYEDFDSLNIRYLKEALDLSLKTKFRYGLAYGKYYDVLELRRNGRYDEAIDKCKQCIASLDSLHVIVGKPLANIRILFNLAGKQEERFRFYSEKVAYYREHGPAGNLGPCYHAIAGYYAYLADYDKSIEYYLRAIDVFKSNDPHDISNEYQVIGSIYLLWGNYGKAEEYLNLAMIDLVKSNDAFFCIHQLGDLNFARHDYKRALHYYFEGRKYTAKIPEYQAINLVDCAAVHLQLNSRDSAKFYLDSSEKIRQKNKLGLVFSHGNIEIDYNFYRYYRVLGNDQHALECLETALQQARAVRYFPLILKYTNELHSFLLKKGDSLHALRCLIQYHAIQDTLNAMNTRAMIASFEIEQQEQQKEKEITQLKLQKTSQRNYYIIGGILLILIVLGVLSRWRYKRKRDREQMTTEFQKQLAEAETKALRAQMNPHFIFNSLNSINSFVMDQKHEIASEYLIKFSKLIRLILDNSRSETISLEKELETLKLYVILESARFDNKFKCSYKIAGDVNQSSVMIPPMLLQPFVENAIWHGLMQKEGEGTITVEIKKENEEFLNISITDNGIGREKAAELKSKSATHKSHGLKVTSQRIEMMNKLNSTGAKVSIIDLKDEQGNALGTKVELIIPF